MSKKIVANLLGRKEKESDSKIEDTATHFDVKSLMAEAIKTAAFIPDGSYLVQVLGFKPQYNSEAPGVNVLMKAYHQDKKEWLIYEPFILFKTTEGMTKANFQFQDTIIQFMDWLGIDSEMAGEQRLETFMLAFQTETGLDQLLTQVGKEQWEKGTILLPLNIKAKFPRWQTSIKAADFLRDSEDFEDRIAGYMELITK